MIGFLHRVFFWLIWAGCGFGIADLVTGQPWELVLGNAGWMMAGTAGRMWTETLRR